MTQKLKTPLCAHLHQIATSDAPKQRICSFAPLLLYVFALLIIFNPTSGDKCNFSITLA